MIPPDPPSRSVIRTLGAAQCVYWGILYYAYAVLIVPMRVEFGTSEAVIAGAYSLGLLVCALLAVVAGRRFDRGQGVAWMRAGAHAVPPLLVGWSLASGTTMLYVVWVALGACMALVLYEAAFALVTRAVAEPAQRLRALATVTVVGGLASTVFLPLIGAGTAGLGWRATLQLLAVVWLATTLVMERTAWPALQSGERARAQVAATAGPAVSGTPRGVWRLATPFVFATFSSMALTTLVIPTLVARGVPIERAAVVLAGLGLSQLPGRIWLARGGRIASAEALLVAPLVLQAGGLVVFAASPGLVAAFLGIVTYGIGAGMQSIARPWAVPLLFGVGQAGVVNGRIARLQAAARAIGPFATAWAYGRYGTQALFLVLAAMLLALAPMALASARELRTR